MNAEIKIAQLKELLPALIERFEANNAGQWWETNIETFKMFLKMLTDDDYFDFIYLQNVGKNKTLNTDQAVGYLLAHAPKDWSVQKVINEIDTILMGVDDASVRMTERYLDTRMTDRGWINDNRQQFWEERV